MSWSNVLRRSSSDFCVNDNFSGTFVDFCLKIFTQERISTYDDLTVRCFSIAVVKVSRNCCESTLNIAVNGTFEKITIMVTDVVLIHSFSYRWFQTKNENENTEYHGIFISFKS